MLAVKAQASLGTRPAVYTRGARVLPIPPGSFRAVNWKGITQQAGCSPHCDPWSYDHQVESHLHY